MADRIIIEAAPRELIGKRVGQLRREGWVPGVLYGKDVMNVQMETKALRRALRIVGTSHLADLDVNGKKRTVLVRDIQQHLTRGDVLHVDFLEVDMKSTLRATVELVSTGEAVPVEEGLGTVTFVVRNVEIECLPDDLVAELPVDLTLIGTPDDVIRLSDIVLPEGITLLDDPETVVARFEYEAAEEEEELEEGELEAAAEDVEVIARGKQEEEDF
jgi:large subunit ribosomal protein L25